MPELIQYLIKFNIGIAAVYLFYFVFLRRLTFYYWNRYFLLGYTALCFFIPFLNVTPLLHETQTANYFIVEQIPSLPIYTQQATNVVSAAAAQIDYWQFVRWFFYGSFIVMSARLIIQYLSIRNIRANAQIISTEPVEIYQVEKEITPFSFGNGIYLNTALHTEEELQEIIRHEFIHVKQKHSLDILFAELLCIVAWYNPAAWLIRHAIRQNLEFIADGQVLKNGTDRKKYQYMLLKVMGGAPVHIINPFNFSSLKKRIIMMNKIKSSGIHLLKFLFILPLILFMLVAFRQQGAVSILSQIPKVNTDTVPGAKAKSKTTAKPVIVKEKTVVDTKLTKPEMDNVKSILYEIDKATVQLKNGKKEVYYFKNDKERNDFFRKYQQVTEVQPTELASVTSDVAPAALAKPVTTSVKPSADLAAVEEVVAVASSPEKVTYNVTTKSKTANIATTATASVDGETATLANVVKEERATAVEGPITTTGEKVFELTKDFTKEKLDQLVADLKNRGYELNVIKSEFNGGRLTLLEAEVSKGADRSHFTVRDFQKLVFTKVPRNGDDAGFQFYVVKGILHVN